MEMLAAIAPLASGSTIVEAPALSRLQYSGGGFADRIAAGLASADAKVAKADALVGAFAHGAAIPVHEVTLALEQARLSVELAVEVRSRLLEAYRDFMNMQL